MAHVAIFGQALSGVQIAGSLCRRRRQLRRRFRPPLSSQPTPAAPTLYAGQTMRISAQALGMPAPSYQWQIESNGVFVNLNNGSRISGATGPALTISNVSRGGCHQLSSAGHQYVRFDE